MKKILFLLLLCSISIFAFIGCSSPKNSTNETSTDETSVGANSDDTGKKEGATLAFICKDLSQQWFVGTSSSMLETAKDRGAKDVLMFDAAMSPDKYITALDTAISQKVDVLIVCPPDQNLSQITVDRCKAAGIKVMADDDGLIDENGVHIAPALELNAYVVGSTQGEWLGKYYIDNELDKEIDTTDYLCLTMETVSSCVPRSEGAADKFKEIVKDFPDEKLIKADYDGTSDEAFNVAAATITANPNIKNWIVTAPNDEGAQGATRALEQADKDDKAAVVGIGGYVAKDEFKKDYSCFKASAYIDPKSDGQIAANAAMDWIEKGNIPYEEYIKDGEEFGIYPFGAIMVDESNYKEVMGADAE